MKPHFWREILGWIVAIFCWSCWVLAYLRSNLWWLPVSVIPYVLYKRFFPQQEPSDDQDDRAP